MKRYFFILLVLVLISCKKENNDVGTYPSTLKLEHMPLAVGNYWVYEYYYVDTALGIDKKLSSRDSIVVTNDTVINGKVYFVRRGATYTTVASNFLLKDIVRDSSGFLVNEKGVILFAENNFVDTFNTWYFVLGANDTVAKIFYNMEMYLGQTLTPSGNYLDGLNCKETVIQYVQDSSFTKYNKNLYVKNVGMVLKSYFFAGPQVTDWIELRLAKYHIQ